MSDEEAAYWAQMQAEAAAHEAEAAAAAEAEHQQAMEEQQMTTNDEDLKAAEEWANLSVGEVPADRLLEPISYLTLWRRDKKMLEEGFLAGVAHARRWIPVSERLPTKEERDSQLIEWWHGCECCPYSGRFEPYDGKRIWIESRNEWSVAIPLTEFTHWRAVNEPLPPEPKEGE